MAKKLKLGNDLINAVKEIILNTSYPVGRIIVSIDNVNPGTYLGGTWVSFGSGRTLVGVDANQTEFDTVEKTGGSKSHNHARGTLNACIGSPTGNANALGFKAYNPTTGVGPNSTYSVGNAGSATTNGHPGRSHNTEIIGNTDNSSTLQPYITTYFWKRTA